VRAQVASRAIPETTFPLINDPGLFVSPPHRCGLGEPGSSCEEARSDPLPSAQRLSLTLIPLPASAKVVAEGKPSPGGFYWQTVQKSNGSTQYLCRSTKDAAIQKHAKCDGAKAAKP